MEKVKIQCCMLSPKLWSARLFLMKLRSIVSKALQKSSCARIPGMLCIFVCSTTLSTNLIVFPPSPPPPTLYLPFTKPVWPGLLENQNLF